MGEQLKYKTVLDFNDEQIKLIALTYANTNYNYASSAIATEFSRDGEYAIKPRTILKVIQKAIRTALVSEDVAKKIRDKAVHNSAKYGNQNAIDKTYDSYTQLILQRREYIANGGKKTRKVTTTSSTISPEEFEKKVKEELIHLENSLKQVNHKINTFDEFNDEEITLDSLISQKHDLEKKIKDHKFYYGNK